MIKVGSWNIRGLHDPCMQLEVRKLIQDQKLSLMGIVENKVRHQNLVYTCMNCVPPNWDLYIMLVMLLWLELLCPGILLCVKFL